MLFVFILFCFSPLFSLAPYSLVISLNQFLSPQTASSLEHMKGLSLDLSQGVQLHIHPPSFYQKKFLNRMHQTREYAKKKNYNGKLYHINIDPTSEQEIPFKYGSFSSIFRVSLTPDKKEPYYVFSKYRHNSNSSADSTCLYSSNLAEDQDKSRLFYASNQSSELLSSFNSFESIISSHFQFLVDIFENKLNWNQFDPQKQFNILFYFSRTLLLANEFSEAKRIARLLFSSRQALNSIFYKNIVAIFLGFTDKVLNDSEKLPSDLIFVHTLFKHRWISLNHYEGLNLISYTVGDQNLSPYCQGGDIIDYINSEKELEPLFKDLISHLLLLSRQRIVQCDSSQENLLVDCSVSPLQVFAIDFAGIFSEVDEHDTLLNLDIIPVFLLDNILINKTPEDYCNFIKIFRSDSLAPFIRRTVNRLIYISTHKGLRCDYRLSSTSWYSTCKFFFSKTLSQIYSLSEKRFHFQFNHQFSPYATFYDQDDEVKACILFSSFIHKLQFSFDCIKAEPLDNMLYFFCFLLNNLNLPLYTFFIQSNEDKWFALYDPYTEKLLDIQPFLRHIKQIRKECEFIFLNQHTLPAKPSCEDLERCINRMPLDCIEKPIVSTVYHNTSAFS